MDPIEQEPVTLLWMAIGRSVGTAAVATNVPPAGRADQQAEQTSRAAELQSRSTEHQSMPPEET